MNLAKIKKFVGVFPKKDLKKPLVFVAMSGGVDSSVTAALLKKQRYEVVGVHIKMWSDPDIPCNFKEDRYDAMRVAAVLDIPYHTWDLTKEYKKEVVEYMIREFRAGRTPNPDVMCNREIKFGVFLKKALAAGADFVATGHYIRLENGKLKIAKDLNKDQSYFLWTLNQNQLKHCLFPIGDYLKPEIRELAKKLKLPTADKKDSQGICFIGEIDLRAFLKKYIKSKPGKIVTTGGKIVGKHEGLQFYTIGQRRGFSVGGGIPFYVVAKDFKKNILVVGEGPYDENLFGLKLKAVGIHWIAGKKPKLPMQCLARIRYRQPLQNCTISLQPTTYNLQAVFSSPQRAVTSGQSIVFYRGEEMLGGGIIK